MVVTANAFTNFTPFADDVSPTVQANELPACVSYVHSHGHPPLFPVQASIECVNQTITSFASGTYIRMFMEETSSYDLHCIKRCS